MQFPFLVRVVDSCGFGKLMFVQITLHSRLRATAQYFGSVAPAVVVPIHSPVETFQSPEMVIAFDTKIFVQFRCGVIEIVKRLYLFETHSQIDGKIRDDENKEHPKEKTNNNAGYRRPYPCRDQKPHKGKRQEIRHTR